MGDRLNLLTVSCSGPPGLGEKQQYVAVGDRRATSLQPSAGGAVSCCRQAALGDNGNPSVRSVRLSDTAEVAAGARYSGMGTDTGFTSSHRYCGLRRHIFRFSGVGPNQAECSSFHRVNRSLLAINQPHEGRFAHGAFETLPYLFEIPTKRTLLGDDVDR